MSLAFIRAFSSHKKKGSSTQLLSHHYFTSFILGLDFPCGKVTWQKRSQDPLLGNVAWKFMQGSKKLVGKTFSALSSAELGKRKKKCSSCWKTP
jgi:hypothetical protein